MKKIGKATKQNFYQSALMGAALLVFGYKTALTGFPLIFLLMQFHRPLFKGIFKFLGMFKFNLFKANSKQSYQGPFTSPPNTYPRPLTPGEIYTKKIIDLTTNPAYSSVGGNIHNRNNRN